MLKITQSFLPKLVKVFTKLRDKKIEVFVTHSRRCLHTTMVSLRDGERGMPATLSKKEIERQVRDESKGVFRVLDIGKPKPVSFKKKDFKSRSYPARAPPR